MKSKDKIFLSIIATSFILIILLMNYYGVFEQQNCNLPYDVYGEINTTINSKEAAYNAFVNNSFFTERELEFTNYKLSNVKYKEISVRAEIGIQKKYAYILNKIAITSDGKVYQREVCL